jgi:hypothetical protein
VTRRRRERRASLQVRVHRLDNAVHHGGTRLGAPTMLIVHATED